MQNAFCFRSRFQISLNTIIIVTQIHPPCTNAIFIPFFWIQSHMPPTCWCISFWYCIPEYFYSLVFLPAFSHPAWNDPSTITYPFYHSTTPSGLLLCSTVIHIKLRQVFNSFSNQILAHFRSVFFFDASNTHCQIHQSLSSSTHYGPAALTHSLPLR